MIKENRDWLVGTAPVVQEASTSLEEKLGQRDFFGLNLAAIDLDVLAEYYGRAGEIRVLDGDVAGWVDLHKAIAYHYWSLKICVQVFAKKQVLRNLEPAFDLTTHAPIAASLHCYYLVIGDVDKQTFTFDVLRSMAVTRGVVDEAFWKRRIFEPFVLRLRRKLEELDLPQDLEGRDIGPYGKVLEFWGDPGQFARAISDVADYHCEKMFERRGDWGPEFINAPFDLLPCEIFAVLAIRRKLGLPVPTVEHPLLATPLGKLDGDPGSGTDVTLRRVEQVYSEVFLRS
jgi:hypothetical protein